MLTALEDYVLFMHLILTLCIVLTGLPVTVSHTGSGGSECHARDGQVRVLCHTEAGPSGSRESLTGWLVYTQPFILIKYLHAKLIFSSPEHTVLSVSYCD